MWAKLIAVMRLWLWLPVCHGAQPWIALGLAGNLNSKDALVSEAVETWWGLGGRAVDAALMYRNNEGLRVALGRVGAVHVTTKVPPEEMGFQLTWAAVQRARELKGQLDAVLIHWPGRTWAKRATDPACVVPRGEAAGDWTVCRKESWAALRRAKAEGLVKELLGSVGGLFGAEMAFLSRR